jgi:hypothetical protein
MGKISTVFAPFSTSEEELIRIVTKHNLAIGPFGDNNSAELEEFLRNKLHKVRCAAHNGSNHSIYLLLRPSRTGNLIETINLHKHLGLIPSYIQGLVLDSTEYSGSIPELFGEASSFGGSKFFWYSSSNGSLTSKLDQIKQRNDCSGIFIQVDNPEQVTRYRETVGLLTEAKIARIDIPIWTQYFKAESLRANMIFLGSWGHHATPASL